MASAPTWIALIRAIGGATHAKMPMASLRKAATAAGLEEARTVLATGNLIFTSPRPEADLQDLLTKIMQAHGLGPAQEVFLRRPMALRDAMDANPFPGAAAERPSRLLLHMLTSEPSPHQKAAVEAWAGPEECILIGRDLFIDFKESIGTSRLTPSVLDRLLGQTGTARNWNTIGKILGACASGPSQA